MSFRSIGTKIQLLAGLAFMAGLAVVLAMQTYTKIDSTRRERLDANLRIVHGLSGPASGAIAIRDKAVVDSYMGLLTVDPRAAGIVISSGGEVIESKQSIDHFDMPMTSLADTALLAEKTGKRQILDTPDYEFVGVPVVGPGGKRVGAIAVAWSNKGLLDNVWQGAIQETLAFLAVIVGVLLVLVLALRKMVTWPLMNIAERIEKVTTGHSEADPASVAQFEARSDEIGTFARALGRFYRGSAETHMLHGQLDSALTNMSQGLCMFDGQGKLIISNSRFTSMYGLNPTVVKRGLDVRDLAGLLQDCVVKSRIEGEAIRLADAGLDIAAAETRELGNGMTVTISRQMTDGVGWVETHTDVSDLRRAEKQLTFLADHDALTGLPNRRKFRDQIDEYLAELGTGQTLAVMLLDLDRFKAVNDNFGHAAGDALLQVVAERLRDCAGEGCSVYRLGGDEFAILQLATEQPKAANAMAFSFTEALLRPIDVLGHQIQVGVSTGIAIAPRDGVEAKVLLQNADMASYRAKSDGRSVHRFFTAEMNEHQLYRKRLEIDLRTAVERHQLQLDYQPIIDISSHKIVGVEALARWHHPELGVIPPSRFIPIAEDTGLIVAIGEWIMREACGRAAQWPASIRLSVNISASQLQRSDLSQCVFGALAATGMAASRLELELTESILLHDDEQTLAQLRRLRSFGALIAMDDFGSGYSALNYLNKFPVDRIKLDRAFVNGLQDSKTNRAIINAVAAMCQSLGIRTVAEGVETPDQSRVLTEAGINEMQGYLYSRPVSVEEIDRLLRTDHSVTGLANGGAAA